jgi:hypothetical protein
VQVATLSQISGGTPQQIVYEDGRFTLEGHGEVSAQDIVDLETRGKLEWAYSGLREWVHYFATPGHGSPQGHGGANEDCDTQDARQIVLNEGQIALVDAADCAWLGRWKWSLQRWYVEEAAARAVERKFQQMFGDLVQPVVEEDSESDPTTLF